MKLKIDENLPLEASRILQQAGYDSATVYDQKLTGASDEELFAKCKVEDRVLVTVDLDFSNIQTYPPGKSAGLIILRLKHLDKTSVLRAVQSLLPSFKAESPVAKLWIVEEDRIRIRE